MARLMNPNNASNGSFLPQEYVKNKSQVRANFVALLLFTLVMAGVIGAFFVNHQRWRSVNEQAQVISAQFEEEAAKIEQLKALEAQRIDLLDRAEVVTALIDRVPRSVLMAELVRDMPAGITLTLVSLEGERVKPPTPAPDPKAKAQTRSLTARSTTGPDKQPAPQKVMPPRFRHTVTVEGLASENEKIADYLAAIKASALFSEVELPLITSTIIDQEAFRRFKITMSLRDQADARQVAGVEQFELDRAAFGVTTVDTLPPTPSE